MPVTVRRAAVEDAAKVAEFAVLINEQHVGYDPVRFSRMITREGAEKFYRDRVDAPDAAGLVAELEGEIVGFAYLQYEPQAFEDILTNAVWLHDIYIDEAARRKGVGHALMSAVADAAKEFGAEKTVLATAAKNEKGRAFFESLGFKTTMHEMMLVTDQLQKREHEGGR
jgi:GNAT superfamily N-acetyltransferase